MSETHSKTSVRCVAYSTRDPKPIDLSDAMVGYRTRKARHLTGQATFELKALRNWQNVLAENDLIAFYIDVGDKYGPDWVLWGYVDSVGNPSTVAQDRFGAPVLGTYTLQCSDFQKALDARVYQNLALVGRKDLVIDQDFASVGALGTGVNMTIFGSPSDILESLLVTTLGFGQQGTIPASVPEDPRERQQRVDMLRRAVLRLPVGVTAAYPRLTPEAVELPDFEQIVTQALADARAKVKAKQGQDISGMAEGLALLSVITRRTSVTAKRTMVDMMSFDFVERKCIDGYSALPPLLPNQGTVNVTLNQLVQENVNPIVNELIFDLRPAAEGRIVDADAIAYGNDMLGDGDYDESDDVLGLNEADDRRQGIRYVPAVVLREYPFSTVPGIDLRGYTVGTPPDVKRIIANQGVNTRSFNETVTLGVVPFGPIFSVSLGADQVGGGRVYFNYGAPLSNLSPQTSPLPAVKHLDVVQVRHREILNDTIARAGSGSANLVAVVDNSYGASMMSTWVGEMLPIVTPVAIARDRLQVQELKTKFLGGTVAPPRPDGSKPSNSGSIAARAVRWALLWDHWHQHDYEYLSGTITTKGQRPDIRVGYRLDVLEWKESYYVEAVEHSGQLVGGVWNGQTTIEVSRGQRNDPLPWYVPPQFSKSLAERFGFNQLFRSGGGNRGPTGRLAQFFKRLDPLAVVTPTLGSQARNDVDVPYYDSVLRGTQPPMQFIPLDSIHGYRDAELV